MCISLIKKRLPCPYPEILKNTVTVSANTAFFYKTMYILLIHFQSGIQARTSHSSSQSRWLPQLCFLRNSLSNPGNHWSFHVYSTVTTVPEGLFTGHLYSSISSTSTYASTEHHAVFSLPQAPWSQDKWNCSFNYNSEAQERRETNSSNNGPLKRKPWVFEQHLP